MLPPVKGFLERHRHDRESADLLTQESVAILGGMRGFTAATAALLLLIGCGDKGPQVTDGIEWVLEAGPLGPQKVDVVDGKTIKAQDLKIWGSVKNTRSAKLDKVVFTLSYAKGGAPVTGEDYRTEFTVGNLAPGETRHIRTTIGTVGEEWEGTTCTIQFKEATP
jgi:hypothetical protein